MGKLQRIAVYLGSAFGVSTHYREATIAFGTTCALRGLGVVYGGGGIGLMGVLADATLAAGGQVHGVIPKVLIAQERAHRGLTELIPVDTMHERKATMERLADAFVALPGGMGTLDETFEMITWVQLGLHHKPIGILNVRGFYDPLLRMLDHLTEQGFVTEKSRSSLIVATEPEALLDRLAHRSAGRD